MYILGLTGSIGMGKSTAARAFRLCGVAVFDADAAVHNLLGPKGRAVKAVSLAFPSAVENNVVNREVLGSIVYDNKQALSKLESILHPLARRQQLKFLRQNAKARNKLVVLDIPLLFEKRLDRFCDAVVVVTAPGFLQKIRGLSRAGMTNKRYYQILENQMPDDEKRRRADFLIQTGLNKKHSFLCIRNIIVKTQNHRHTIWSRQRVRFDA